MNASAKPAERRPEAQDEEPAKGGIKPAHERPIRPATASSRMATRCGTRWMKPQAKAK